MTAPTKTPESLSAAARAAQLSKEGAGAANKVSAHEVRARLSLASPRPPNAAAGLRAGDDMDGSTLLLPVKAVRLYENNPRISQNPKYAQIRESIVAQGVTNTIAITKRPGDDAYIVAAGGNTRLAIVQELYDETGDPRWESLSFRFRAWRGEAAVIAAHLAENENRGDTSFWEKARGLAAMRAELEKDLGRPLSAPDLAKEAKRLGMDFGVSLVKYLVFATECLAPIGPWLTARTVMEALQPTYAGLQALVALLAKRTPDETRSLFDGVLQAQATYLSSQQDLATDDQAALLDAGEIVRALSEAAAAAVGVPAARVPLMLAARANNQRISADELRQVGNQASAVPAGFGSGSSVPAPALQAAQQQMPLRPSMLATVPAAATPPSPAGQGQDAAASASGAPQRALEPEAPGATTSVPPVDATDEELAETARRFGPGALSHRSREGSLLRDIASLLAEIGPAAELNDVLSMCQTMPLSYFVELPEGGIDSIDGETPRDPNLRRAAWHVLAGLSGQWVPAVAKEIPAEQSRWRMLLDKGDLCEQAALLTMTSFDLTGQVAIGSEDATRVFLHPTLGPAIGAILERVAQLRACAPERFAALDRHWTRGGQ